MNSGRRRNVYSCLTNFVRNFVMYFKRLIESYLRINQQSTQVYKEQVNLFCNDCHIGLFLQPTLMHNSISTCMSHYYPRHISGLDMPILRRNNCTNTASGILALLSGCTLHRLRASALSYTARSKKHQTATCFGLFRHPQQTAFL